VQRTIYIEEMADLVRKMFKKADLVKIINWLMFPKIKADLVKKCSKRQIW